MSTNPVQLLSAMPSRRFLKPWSVEPMPSGYRVIDANGLALAHINGEPQNAVVPSPNRLSDDEVRRMQSGARLPDLVELERDRNGPQPSQAPGSPLQAGDYRSWSLPGRRYSDCHHPEPNGREVCGNVDRAAGAEGVAERQGPMAEAGDPGQAQHLKAKGTLRHATVKQLLIE